ncbi:hypothetical protein [Sphaerochaeta sp. PS]|uniref:hypothetical protein n=1 Tax=Sphaerochaeta sp. PS TaxID=3076336 RepID=UPI0028A54028|nr:hypothetical protein [Sphaerochaeta sp. PS]MDT4762479.1 hypothetical protein [Sphaerochaeta sp. PS]
MGKNGRFVFLGIQAIITFFLTGFLVHALLLANEQQVQSGVLSHLVPSLVHLWITLIAALLLCVFYRANIGAEARFLPLLFLMICLGNVKVLPLYQHLSHIMILSPYWTGIIYHFSFLFSTFLFLASGLFQQTMNPVRLGQYSFIGSAISLLLSMLVPISANSSSFLKEASITNTLFLGVTIMVSALAVITFIIAIYEENGSRQTVVRCLSFMLMIVGNATVTISQNPLYNAIGLALYVAGATLLILVTRTYHIWA